MLPLLCTGAIPGVFHGNGPVQAVYPGMVPEEERGSDMKKRTNVFVQMEERVRRIPITLSCAVDKSARPMEGRVVYIHSKGRFHTVEFWTPGGPLRESFAGILR